MKKDIPCITLDKDFRVCSQYESHLFPECVFEENYFKELFKDYSIRDFESPRIVHLKDNKDLFIYKSGEFVKCALFPNTNNKDSNIINYRMREPISSIFALLPMIVDNINSDDGDKAVSHIEEVYSKSYKLLRNITNLSLAEKIESANNFIIAPINLSSLVESLVLSVKTVVRDIDINCDIQNDVCVKANKGLLVNGILNIITNSIVYRNDEKPSVDISVSTKGDNAVLTYSDNSKGIKDRIIGDIFRPFYSRDPYDDGGLNRELGLGLYIAKAAFDRAGGNIFLTSTFGKGIKYTISMPLYNGEEMVIESNPSDFLLNKFSEVFVQLCEHCRLPSIEY